VVEPLRVSRGEPVKSFETLCALGKTAQHLVAYRSALLLGRANDHLPLEYLIGFLRAVGKLGREFLGNSGKDRVRIEKGPESLESVPKLVDILSPIQPANSLLELEAYVSKVIGVHPNPL